MTVSNREFADMVGCDYTTASRIRNGKRKVSLKLFNKIITVFKLDCDEALSAFEKDQFGPFLQENVFNVETVSD